jgi:hypothetical protein
MMLKPTVAIGHHNPLGTGRAPPMAGIAIGTAISLLLWAMILAVVFVVR